MLRSLLSGNFGLSTIMSLCASVFVVFCTIPIHEYAHALTATKLGDPTPRLKGRLTINPLAHIDIMGALMLFIVGFGYAKPVPVNPRNFKNPKAGMAITAAAGPISNVIMATVFMIIANLAFIVFANTQALVANVTLTFFLYAAQINIYLAVFNLLPIPPLDGSRILTLILPSKIYYKVMQYERYIVIVVFILLFFRILSVPLSWLSDKLMFAVSWLVSLPFGDYGAAFMGIIR